MYGKAVLIVVGSLMSGAVAFAQTATDTGTDSTIPVTTGAQTTDITGSGTTGSGTTTTDAGTTDAGTTGSGTTGETQVEPSAFDQMSTGGQKHAKSLFESQKTGTTSLADGQEAGTAGSPITLGSVRSITVAVNC